MCGKAGSVLHWNRIDGKKSWIRYAVRRTKSNWESRNPDGSPKMPEGHEVKRYADELSSSGKKILAVFLHAQRMPKRGA